MGRKVHGLLLTVQWRWGDVKELKAREDTVSYCWPGPDLFLLRSSTEFHLRNLIYCASVWSDVPHACCTSDVVALHQSNVFFLSYEQSSEDNYANSWVFKIGLMLLVVVFTIFHKTRIIRELSVKIMNHHIYGKHMSMMWIMLLFWVWIFSVHREGFRSCDKTTDVRLATLYLNRYILKSQCPSWWEHTGSPVQGQSHVFFRLVCACSLPCCGFYVDLGYVHRPWHPELLSNSTVDSTKLEMLWIFIFQNRLL